LVEMPRLELELLRQQKQFGGGEAKTRESTARAVFSLASERKSRGEAGAMSGRSLRRDSTATLRMTAATNF
jgi:hypothetical protein